MVPIVQNFKGLCVGDVNGSNYPVQSAKSQHKIELVSNDILKLHSNESFEIPVKATGIINVSSFSLILKYPKDLVTINNIHFSDENSKFENNNEAGGIFFNILNDEVRIGWIENEEPINFINNEPVFFITGKTKINFKSGDLIKFFIANDPLCEFANEAGNTIENVVLNSYSIEHSNEQYTGNNECASDIDMFIFPNPVNNKVTVAIQGFPVTKNNFIFIYDLQGQKILEESIQNEISQIDVSGLAKGIYILKHVNGEKTEVIKFVKE